MAAGSLCHTAEGEIIFLFRNSPTKQGANLHEATLRGMFLDDSPPPLRRYVRATTLLLA